MFPLKSGPPLPKASLTVGLFLIWLATVSLSLVPEHQIFSIPDYPPLLSRNFAGYLTAEIPSNASANHSSSYFYYFIESESAKPWNDPLLIVQEGGPGCSTDYMLFTESGPYVFRLGGTWWLNEYRWSLKANLLYFDAPPGVGFSLDFPGNSTNTSNSTTIWTDALSSRLNYEFLKQWLLRYPEFKNRTMYLTGISYAGHYTPQLAAQILHGDDVDLRRMMNGFFLGSPCIGTGITNQSDPLYNLDWCFTDGANADPTLPEWFRAHGFESYDSRVSNVPDPQAVGDPPWEGSIDAFDVYWTIGPTCALDDADYYTPPEEGKKKKKGQSSHSAMMTMMKNPFSRGEHEGPRQQSLDLQKATNRPNRQRRERRSTRAMKSQSNSSSSTYPAWFTATRYQLAKSATAAWQLPVAPYEPCTEYYLHDFLNRDDVQKALHVWDLFQSSSPPTAGGSSSTPPTMKIREWRDCSGVSNNFHYPTPPTIPGVKAEYFDLMNNTNWSLFVYSGTNDISVNFIQTQKNIVSFGRTPLTNYTPWYYPDPFARIAASNAALSNKQNTSSLWKQLGGWCIKYDRISWASVRGAGHMADQTNPARVFHLLTSFLETGGPPMTFSHDGDFDGATATQRATWPNHYGLAGNVNNEGRGDDDATTRTAFIYLSFGMGIIAGILLGVPLTMFVLYRYCAVVRRLARKGMVEGEYSEPTSMMT